LSPLLGLQYSYNEKWLIGLAYQNVSKLNYEKEFVSTSYDFGYRNKTTLIKQINLHYIALPLAYQYSFKQNSINFGISPCIMIFNKSIINEKTITPFYEDLVASNSSYAYSHGLSTVDIQLSLGYKRIVSKKLTIGIDYNLGLVDVRNKSWTNNTNIERNKFISLKLNYKIR